MKKLSLNFNNIKNSSLKEITGFRKKNNILIQTIYYENFRKSIFFYCNNMKHFGGCLNPSGPERKERNYLTVLLMINFLKTKFKKSLRFEIYTFREKHLQCNGFGIVLRRLATSSNLNCDHTYVFFRPSPMFSSSATVNWNQILWWF